MTNLLYRLLSALVLTIAIESIPLFFCHSRSTWLTAGLLCNCATNPVLNILRILFYSLWPDLTALLYLTVILEVAVVFIEAWLYTMLTNTTPTRAVLLSLLCNSLSFFIGTLIM